MCPADFDVFDVFCGVAKATEYSNVVGGSFLPTVLFSGSAWKPIRRRDGSLKRHDRDVAGIL
jgi:hypothetical protein